MAFDPWAGFDEYKKKPEESKDPWAGFDDFKKKTTATLEPKKEPIKLAPSGKKRLDSGDFIVSGQTRTKNTVLPSIPPSPSIKERAIKEVESIKQVGRDIKQTAGEVLSVVKNRFEKGIKPVFSALGDYLTQKEKTSAGQDVVAGLEAAKLVGKESAGFLLDTGETLTRGLVRTIDNANRGRETVSGNATLAAARYIDDTFNTVGKELRRDYQVFNQVKPDAVDFATAILGGGMQVAGALTTDAGELALAAAQEVPGFSIPARALTQGISVVQDNLAKGFTEALKLTNLDDEQSTRAGQIIASIATAGIAVKGIQKAGSFSSRVVEKTVSKVNQLKEASQTKQLTEAITDQNIDVTVRRAAAEVMAEDGNATLKNALDAAHLPQESGGPRAVRKLTPVESLYFESEMRGNSLNDFGDLANKAAQDGFELEVKNLTEQAAKDGATIKVDSDPFDRFPARYDIKTNSIVFNWDAVKDHLTRMFRDGEAIVYGSGQFQRVMRVKPGESFDAFRNRYIREMYDHEVAHAKTISATDLARLDEATRAGNQAEQRKIIQELEDRANDFVIKTKDKILSEADQANVDKLGEAFSTVERFRADKGKQPFGDTELDSSYDIWRRLVKRNKDILNEGSEALSARLMRNNEAYPDQKSVDNALFNKASQGTQFEGRLTVRDDYLEMFRKRFEAEEKAKADFLQARETLRSSQQSLVRQELSKKDIADLIKEAAKEERTSAKERIKEIKRKAADKLERKVNVLESRMGKKDIEYTRKLAEARVERVLDIALTKSRERAIVNKAKDNMKSARKLAKKYLVEMRVPKEVRGKLLHEFARLRSPEKIQTFIDRVSKEWSMVKRRDLRKAIKKELKTTVAKVKNGTRRGKFTPEVQRDLDTIRLGINGDKGKAFDTYVKLIEDWREKNGYAPLPDDIVKQVEILQTVGVKSQDVFALNRTLETIRSLKEEGKTARQSELDKMKAKAKNTRELILKDIPEARKGLIGQRENAGRILTTARGYNASIKTLDFLADYVSQKSKKEAYSSAFSNFTSEVRTRWNRERAMIRADESKVSDLYSKVYGKPKGRKLDKVINEIRNVKLNLGKVTDASGKTFDLKLTKDQMMYIEALTRNQAIYERLKNENNLWTDEMFATVRKNLTEKDMQVVDGYLDLFREKYPEYSKAIEQDTGLFLGKQENYVPVSTKQTGAGAADKTAAESLLTPEAAYTMSARPGSSKVRSKGAQGTISLDRGLSSQYVNYVDAANHYITHWDFVREANSVLSDGEIGRRISDNFGKEYWDEIKYHLDEAINGRVSREMIIPVLQKWHQNVASALIQSFNVVAGQPSSYLQFFAESPRSGTFLKATSEATGSPKMAYNELKKYSNVFTERYADQSVLRALSGLEGREMNAIFSGKRTIQDALGVPVTLADKVTTTLGGYGYFKSVEAKLLQAGVSPEMAKVRAGLSLDKILSRTQSEAGRVGKSSIEKKYGTFGKLFVTFSNQPQKILQVQLGAIRNFRNGRLSAGKLAKILFFTGPVMSAMYESMRHGTQTVTSELGLTQPPNEELGKKIFGNAISQPLSGLPMVRDIVNTAYRAFSGNRTSFRPSILFSTIDNAVSAFEQAGSGDWEDAAIETAKFATKSFGIGFMQAPLSKLQKEVGKK